MVSTQCTEHLLMSFLLCHFEKLFQAIMKHKSAISIADSIVQCNLDYQTSNYPNTLIIQTIDNVCINNF